MLQQPAISLVAIVFFGASLGGQTLDEILSRNFEARGGPEKIKALQSQRISGRISFGPDSEGALTVEMARPGKMRQQLILHGKTMIQTTDGKTGWAVTLPDAPEPRALTAGELKNMAGGADFDGPLVDYRARGNRVELAGRAKVEDRDVWKLVVTMKGGDVRTDYIDCQRFLETKWEGTIESEGKQYNVESYFRDYRKVDGLMYAFRIESDTVGTPVKQVIQLDKVELNVAGDERRYGKP
jgi:hypothetical protein